MTPSAKKEKVLLIAVKYFNLDCSFPTQFRRISAAKAVVQTRLRPLKVQDQ